VFNESLDAVYALNDDVKAYDPVFASFDAIRDDSEDENAATSVGKPAIEPENEPVIPAVDEIEPVTWIPPLSMINPFLILNCPGIVYTLVHCP
jgi:hypothetical protein